MKQIFVLKSIFLILGLLLLSSCSILSPVKMPTQSSYEISQLPHFMPHKKSKKSKLFILPPETYPVYDTTEMAYTVIPYQVGYFVKNQWIATPSQMIYPLLVQTLWNTNHFKLVTSAPFIGQYDYVLQTKILRLRQNYLFTPPMVELQASVSLLKGMAQRPLVTRYFIVRLPMQAFNPYAGVIATNKAVSVLLYRIACLVIAYT